MSDNKSNREFVREQIKKKPPGRRQMIQKMVLSAVCGAVFALMAVLVLAAFSPLLRQYVRSEEHSTQMGSEKPMQETETAAAAETKDGKTEEEKKQKKKAEDDQTQTPVEVELTLKEYQKIQDKLYTIGRRFRSSVVTITSVVGSKDWFNRNLETEGQGIGVIFRKTSEKCWILTEYKAIADAKKLRVTFANKVTREAALVAADDNTGLAVLTVGYEKNGAIDNGVSAVKYGDAGQVESGKLVIAFGVDDSILTGTVISTEHKFPIVDTNLRLFTTDIAAGVGKFLVDADGRLLGVEVQGAAADSGNLFTVVSIGDIEPVISLLAQGSQIPSLGAYVSTVTGEISREYDLPEGVYVTELKVDSPAMEGGLKNGDIITALNNTDIATEEEYHKSVLDLQPEQDCEVTIQRKTGEDYREITCTLHLKKQKPKKKK